MPPRRIKQAIFLVASVSFYLTTIKLAVRRFEKEHTQRHSSDDVTKYIKVKSQHSHVREVTLSYSTSRKLQTQQQDSSQDTFGHLIVEAALSSSGITLWLNGKQVYKLVNKTLEQGKNLRLHAGVHMMTLHQRSGKVMRATTYLTWQPENSRQLSQAITDATDGRLLLFLATVTTNLILHYVIKNATRSSTRVQKSTT
ncbi:uncharacterized protein [Cherax quadricarinatus]|uniref:uncharacterized protein n=1 Tax=Cherax quadricarinatus TaxID=27406 RepID=UPI0023793C29|nr:uncharacterized protein LOC128690143 [Cherax quadricarinatus]